jgi:hypothetical protein
MTKTNYFRGQYHRDKILADSAIAEKNMAITENVS